MILQLATKNIKLVGQIWRSNNISQAHNLQKQLKQTQNLSIDDEKNMVSLTPRFPAIFKQKDITDKSKGLGRALQKLIKTVNDKTQSPAASKYSTKNKNRMEGYINF